MFSRPNLLLATLTSMTLISATVGAISLLPTVGLAQTFIYPSPRRSCAELVQRLDLSTAQQEQTTAICDRAQGRMTTEIIIALRAILDNIQLETFEQKVREVQRLINYGNDCGEKSDHIFRFNTLPELKCR